MAKTGRCKTCGRTVTIPIGRGEYVARGLEGYRDWKGDVYCEGNRHGPEGKCATIKDGETVYISAEEA